MFGKSKRLEALAEKVDSLKAEVAALKKENAALLARVHAAELDGVKRELDSLRLIFHEVTKLGIKPADAPKVYDAAATKPSEPMKPPTNGQGTFAGLARLEKAATRT